jgi:hypothetical protein
MRGGNVNIHRNFRENAAGKRTNAIFSISKAQSKRCKVFLHLLVYNSNKRHKPQSLFYLTTAVHVLGVTITDLQEHKTTEATASEKTLHHTVVCCYRGR